MIVSKRPIIGISVGSTQVIFSQFIGNFLFSVADNGKSVTANSQVNANPNEWVFQTNEAEIIIFGSSLSYLIDIYQKSDQDYDKHVYQATLKYDSSLPENYRLEASLHKQQVKVNFFSLPEERNSKAGRLLASVDHQTTRVEIFSDQNLNGVAIKLFDKSYEVIEYQHSTITNEDTTVDSQDVYNYTTSQHLVKAICSHGSCWLEIKQRNQDKNDSPTIVFQGTIEFDPSDPKLVSCLLDTIANKVEFKQHVH